MPPIQFNFYPIIGLVAMLALLLIGIGLTMWQRERANDMLNKWAAQNQFRIEQREHRLFRKGPFLWTTGRGQYVYRVVVRDQNGRERTGWVRLGSWLFGIWDEKVQVYWEDEARA